MTEATSPYLNRPPRSTEQAIADIQSRESRVTVHGYNDDVETRWGTYGRNDIEEIRPSLKRHIECFRYMLHCLECDKQRLPDRIAEVTYDDAIEGVEYILSNLEMCDREYNDVLRELE